MFQVLSGRVCDRVPVTPHWWGLYKFQHAGLISGYNQEGIAWSQGADKLFEIDRTFYERFKPDMFHLTTAPDLLPFDANKQSEITRLQIELKKLESKAVIDEYVSLVARSENDVVRSGQFRHVAKCAEIYGNEVFIALNEGSDTAVYFDWHLGFEDGLIGLLENPENASYLLHKLYTNTLERMKALKASGAHGFINSETYCSSDIISPLLYRDIFLPIQKEFYKKVRDIGLYTIAYFTGDIWPILDSIKELDINALMTEESKKTFSIDVGDLSERLEGKIACFGNLDSHYILEKGSVDEVKNETLRQLESTRNKPFVMANGCPISFDTPAHNIDQLIYTTRCFGK